MYSFVSFWIHVRIFQEIVPETKDGSNLRGNSILRYDNDYSKLERTITNEFDAWCRTSQASSLAVALYFIVHARMLLFDIFFSLLYRFTPRNLSFHPLSIPLCENRDTHDFWLPKRRKLANWYFSTVSDFQWFRCSAFNLIHGIFELNFLFRCDFKVSRLIINVIVSTCSACQSVES